MTPIARRPGLTARVRPFRSLLVALLALVGAADPSWAHEGEDHGAAAPSTGAGAVTTAAMTGRFEVVLKHAPVRGGEPYVGTLYLADYATNRPVAGATVTISALGAAGAPFTTEATAEPGVYAVTRAGGFPADGRYDVTVSVSAGGVSDLVLLSGLYVGPAAAPVEPAAATGVGGAGVPWLWILVVGASAAGLALFLVRSARQRRQAPVPEQPLGPGAPGPDVPAATSPSRRPEPDPTFS